LVTTGISWRASFVLQAAVVAMIVLLSRRIDDPLPADPTRRFDVVGAALSAVGMLFLVIGILQAGNNNVLLAVFLAVGAAVLAWFFVHVRSDERAGKEPLLSRSLFRSRDSNLGLVTQNVQWAVLLGSAFVISVFLQTVRHYSAIKTGVIFTAATAGILLSSLAAERFAKRRAQGTLIIAGFVTTIAGIGLLLGLVLAWSSVWAFVPGLFVFGLGVGVMLTPSVNVVQSAFGEAQQGEISGLSRAVSNLGSSLGTAIAGTIVVTEASSGNHSYGVAMVVLAGIAVIGLVAAVFLPRSTA
jgi:predicted MFS family arabinose efflux permease